MLMYDVYTPLFIPRVGFALVRFRLALHPFSKIMNRLLQISEN